MKRVTGRVIACITVDVEDSDIESLQGIKEICQKNDTPITWFVNTKDCTQTEALDLLHTFVEGGDEVGLHIHWDGSYTAGLSNISTQGIQDELEEALKLLESRFQVKSFRGGGLSQTTHVLEVLEQKGFEFDSSVAYKLDDLGGWKQGHENVRPVSAYYPSRRSYDAITYDDTERISILELPVTRGIPSPRYWCNLLEPGLTPFYIIRLVFKHYYLRRHFQPLVILVLLMHSWSWNRYPRLAADLDMSLKYISKHNVEFNTLQEAGYEWAKIWKGNTNVRSVLLSSRFHFDLKTWFLSKFIKLAIFISNLRDNPAYHKKAFVSGIHDYISSANRYVSKSGNQGLK